MNQNFEKEDFLKNGWIYDFVAYIFGFCQWESDGATH